MWCHSFGFFLWFGHLCVQPADASGSECLQSPIGFACHERISLSLPGQLPATAYSCHIRKCQFASCNYSTVNLILSLSLARRGWWMNEAMKNKWLSESTASKWPSRTKDMWKELRLMHLYFLFIEFVPSYSDGLKVSGKDVECRLLIHVQCQCQCYEGS